MYCSYRLRRVSLSRVSQLATAVSQRALASSSVANANAHAKAGESRKERRRRQAREAVERKVAYRRLDDGTIEGNKQTWRVVVGLELHAQLASSHKLFSDAPALFGEPPNTLVAPLDAALPGTLPRLNPEAVRLGVQAALALNADVAPVSQFDR